MTSSGDCKSLINPWNCFNKCALCTRRQVSSRVCVWVNVAHCHRTDKCPRAHYVSPCRSHVISESCYLLMYYGQIEAKENSFTRYMDLQAVKKKLYQRLLSQACIYIYMYVYLNISIHIYLDIHTYVYVYIHTYSIYTCI